MLAFLFCLTACEKEELHFKEGDMEITVLPGEQWLHDFPLFLGLKQKNTPQFAIWIEDISGNFLTTIFVTHKIATEGWIFNKGNRRKETLPHWCHQRGVVYEDGLLLPTKKQPLADGITGATPQGRKTIQVALKSIEKPFVVKAEFNHSIDFNSNFPVDAVEGAENYSGGEMGSGQPAVVYAATIYPDTREASLQPIGHSSPDGTDGSIYENLDKLTTARDIVQNIKITIW